MNFSLQLSIAGIISPLSRRECHPLSPVKVWYATISAYEGTQPEVLLEILEVYRMNRRAFLTFMAGLPVIGKYWKLNPQPAKSYSHSVRLSGIETAPSRDYIKTWVEKDLKESIAMNKRWWNAEIFYGGSLPLWWDEDRQRYVKFLRHNPQRLPQ